MSGWDDLGRGLETAFLLIGDAEFGREIALDVVQHGERRLSDQDDYCAHAR